MQNTFVLLSCHSDGVTWGEGPQSIDPYAIYLTNPVTFGVM
jgi:hypothetical protein